MPLLSRATTKTVRENKAPCPESNTLQVALVAALGRQGPSAHTEAESSTGSQLAAPGHGGSTWPWREEGRRPVSTARCSTGGTCTTGLAAPSACPVAGSSTGWLPGDGGAAGPRRKERGAAEPLSSCPATPPPRQQLQAFRGHPPSRSPASATPTAPAAAPVAGSSTGEQLQALRRHPEAPRRGVPQARRRGRAPPAPLTLRSFSGRYLQRRAISTYLSRSRGAILALRGRRRAGAAHQGDRKRHPHFRSPTLLLPPLAAGAAASGGSAASENVTSASGGDGGPHSQGALRHGGRGSGRRSGPAHAGSCSSLSLRRQPWPSGALSVCRCLTE